jgi:hypothetical protein
MCPTKDQYIKDLRELGSVNPQAEQDVLSLKIIVLLLDFIESDVFFLRDQNEAFSFLCFFNTYENTDATRQIFGADLIESFIYTLNEYIINN